MVFAIAFNEHGFHAQIAAEFDVGEGIADDYAGFGGDFGEVGFGLFKEAGAGFAAVALALVVRAEIEAVYVRAGFGQSCLQLGVDGFYVCRSVEAEGDAALVGDYEDAQAVSIQCGNRFRDAGKQVEVLPRGDVLALGHFAVDDSVAVKKGSAKYSLKVRYDWVIGRIAHPVMITSSQFPESSHPP